MADPSAYDVVDNATWPPPADDDDRPERDAIRDLEDPTFGFPIGSLAGGSLAGGSVAGAGRAGRGDPEDESTQVGAPPPRARTPAPRAARAARIETPTMEFTAYQAPSDEQAPGDEPPPRREPAPARQRHAPHRPAPSAGSYAPAAPAPLRRPEYGGGDSAEFEGAPAPVDNSRDDLVDYAEIPGAPPVDLRVVVLLGIFVLSVLMLLGLLILASVVYL